MQALRSKSPGRRIRYFRVNMKRVEIGGEARVLIALVELTELTAR